LRNIGKIQTYLYKPIKPREELPEKGRRFFVFDLLIPLLHRIKSRKIVLFVNLDKVYLLLKDLLKNSKKE